MSGAPARQHYDFVIVGSGFGGSVSAYRLSQKGYSVLVLEKGKHYTAEKFARSNWNFRKWIWWPSLGMRGIMQLSLLKHVTVMSGVGVGGGSLVYGATLPTPGPAFFQHGTWAKLEYWEEKLAPHYKTARKMLGATTNPQLTSADLVLQDANLTGAQFTDAVVPEMRRTPSGTDSIRMRTGTRCASRIPRR